MAETAQCNIELQARCVRALRQTQLFESQEISTITERIKKIEHKLAGANSSLQDFKYAVAYYDALLIEIRRRKRQNQWKLPSRPEYIFIQRIVKTYQRAIKKFPDNYDYHYEFFTFLENFQGRLNHITNNHVKIMIERFAHGSNYKEVFRTAGAWFLCIENLDEARRIMLHAQSMYPQEHQFYTDLVDLELTNPNLKKAKEYIKQYVSEMIKNKIQYKCINDVLDLIEERRHPQITEYVLNQLVTIYKEEVDIWEFLASRIIKAGQDPVTNEYKVDFISHLEKAIVLYKEGIEEVACDKQVILWKKYLDTVADVLKKLPSRPVVNLLRTAIHEAEEAKIDIDESIYFLWIDNCIKPELIVKKMQEGVDSHPAGINLWNVYLKYHLKNDEFDLANNVLERATAALGSKAVQIWDTFINYHMLVSAVSEVDAVFERALSQEQVEIVREFKHEYLSWRFMNGGTEKARELYKRLATQPPYSLKLHQEMFLIEEMSNFKVDADSETKGIQAQVLKLWSQQFGAEDPEVWFHRLKEIQNRGGPGMKLHRDAIYFEARKVIQDNETFSKFKKRFGPEPDPIVIE